MESHNDNFPTSAKFDISILNSIVDPIAVLDENGIIRAVNDSWNLFATQNGGAAVASEIVGQSYLCFCENATSERMDCEAYAALSGLKAVLKGDIREFHLDYVCHSPSEQRWFHMRIVPLSVRNQQRGAIISHTDITPRVRADQALRRSEEQLKFALEATCDGLWDWDIPSGKVYFSDQWLRLLGFHRSEVPERVEFFYEILHPEDRAHVERSLEDHFAGRAPVKQHEVRLKTKSEGYRWFLDRGKVVTSDAAGRPLRMVGTITEITNRKRDEAALQESQLRTRLLIHAASIGLWDWDLVTQEVYFSPEWKLQLGYLDSELPNRYEEWRDRLHPDDLEATMAAVTDFIGGRRPIYDAEFRMRHKDGSWRWMFARADFARDADGRPIRMMGCHIDITDRRRAETALRASEYELRLITSNIPGPVARVDRNLRYLFVNNQYHRLFGIPVDEVTGRTIPEVFGPVIFARVEPHIRTVLSGRRVTFENQFPLPADEMIHSLIHLVPDFDQDQNVVGFFIIGIEITELRHAESAREEAVTRLQKLADRVPGVVYQFRRRNDGTYCFPYASSKIRELLRVCPEELKNDGASAFTNVHPEDLPDLLGSIEFSATNLTLWQAEARFLFPDGVQCWLSGSASPELEPDGSVLWNGFIQDVTPRKQSEAAHASLEAQLRQSQKMEAIGTLAGGIAHDFNNILTAILGNADLATQYVGLPSERVKRSLDEIRRSSLRARDLVSQILSFSRRQPVEKHRISLSAVVNDAVRLLRATFPARTSLHVMIAADLPPVLADTTQLQQVLINLATNSMQAMKGRSGEIHISVDTVSSGSAIFERHPTLRSSASASTGRFVRLTVSDNGPGMDAAVKDRIFEPFFTTKPVDQGTGLGLAVVHGIVQAHHGIIEVESQPGAGAVFTICLPAEDPASGVPEEIFSGSAGGGLTSVSHDHEIVYIDDDPAVTNVIQRLLDGRGFHVHGFTHQSAALEFIQQNADLIAAVVTDYNMPGMQGIDVARAVQQIRHDLPVAVISGLIDEDLQAAAEEAGVRELISKPFQLERFIQTVRKMIQSG